MRWCRGKLNAIKSQSSRFGDCSLDPQAVSRDIWSTTTSRSVDLGLHILSSSLFRKLKLTWAICAWSVFAGNPNALNVSPTLRTAEEYVALGGKLWAAAPDCFRTHPADPDPIGVPARAASNLRA